MLEPNFKIYNASAGSGKPYTLAKAYLSLLLRSENPLLFKNILAITFTNKAVDEMKSRIIGMLKLFSEFDESEAAHPMLEDLCEELNVDANHIKVKSRNALKHILHNYGAFEISTIDGFTHRLIRTFAHDLNLTSNFEVELDQEQLIEEAVNRLISKAGSDQSLTKVLVDFAIEKAEDDRSWDISYDFKEISKLLLNENDLQELQKLKDKSLEEFNELKNVISKEIKSITDFVQDTGNSVIQLIQDSGLQFDNFFKSSIPNYFKKLRGGDFNVNFGLKWQENLIEGTGLYTKNTESSISTIIDGLQPTLSNEFKKTEAQLVNIKFLKAILKNITPLSVLSSISKELSEIKTEKNLMMLSDFNSIISGEIKNQPTPFIYERLGEKFKHFFIDEFQDTSKMQWDNLIPLLDNSLSTSNSSSLLVGDAKQSIYRWRGGDPEQFIALYNKSDVPFQIHPEIISLDSNYRSAEAIINFNNNFFEFLGETYFDNIDYANLYKNALQNKSKSSEGYVDIKFLDIENSELGTELYAEQVLETIKICQENGYNLGDICVITRKRKEGIAISKFLSEHNIAITSSETLLLKNSPKVGFLNALLGMLHNPEDEKIQLNVLSYISKQYNIEDGHAFFSTHLVKDLNSFFSSLKGLGIDFNYNYINDLHLYELVEYLIRCFNLNETSDAFVQYYLDLVLEFVQKEGSDLKEFLNYFDEKQDKLSVTLPDNIDAVQIMTIHKSKGLEFPIVIFPYAELDIYKELKPKIWYPVASEDFNGFQSFLINFNKELQLFGEIGEELYNERQRQLELDNINLLYVTLTRAVEELYIVSKKDISKKGEVNPKTFSGMFISYLQNKGLWNDNQYHYYFGKSSGKPSKEVSLKTESLALISNPKESHNLSVITNSSLLWDTEQNNAIERGNLVHLVLSKIKTVNDIEFALEELKSNGEIESKSISELHSQVTKIISHPQISNYFSGAFKVYNECDILDSSGQVYRPDRLNINDENQVVIIDYKTGSKQARHKSQLNDYQIIIEQMGLLVEKKLLIYINESIEIIEV